MRGEVEPATDADASVSWAGNMDVDGLAGDLVMASALAYAHYAGISSTAYEVFGPADFRPRFRRGAVWGELARDISDAVRLLC